MNKKINQKMNNYMANDMTDEVTQHEYNKNKYYEIQICTTKRI